MYPVTSCFEALTTLSSSHSFDDPLNLSPSQNLSLIYWSTADGQRFPITEPQPHFLVNPSPITEPKSASSIGQPFPIFPSENQSPTFSIGQPFPTTALASSIGQPFPITTEPKPHLLVNISLSLIYWSTHPSSVLTTLPDESLVCPTTFPMISLNLIKLL